MALTDHDPLLDVISIPDLPSTDAICACKTAVTVIVKEPFVHESHAAFELGEAHLGDRWEGVKDILVVLTNGKIRKTARTQANGEARFPEVECGLYSVTLFQEEFAIENLGKTQLMVDPARKSANTLQLKVKRRLLTMEMFRIETRYFEAAGIKEPSGNNDPYGHWFVKLYDSADLALRGRAYASYGWWPKAHALTGNPVDVVWGVPGELNGFPSYKGSNPNLDPYHDTKRTYKHLEDVFYPYVTNGHSAKAYKALLTAEAKAFSSTVSNEWSWLSDGGGWHCKTFQQYVMKKSFVWKKIDTDMLDWSWHVDTE